MTSRTYDPRRAWGRTEDLTEHQFFHHLFISSILVHCILAHHIPVPTVHRSFTHFASGSVRFTHGTRYERNVRDREGSRFTVPSLRTSFIRASFSPS